jgi:hypothetical protein
VSDPETGRGGNNISREKWPRIYTVEEANDLLPLVRRTFDIVDERREELEELAHGLEVLELVATSGATQKNPDYQQYRETKLFFDNAVAEVQGLLTRITDLGVEIRDLETGLVDFYSMRDGRVVFLCWKRGEDRITHWHTVESGFAGRQPIE